MLQPLPAGVLSDPESPSLPQELGEHSSRPLDCSLVDYVFVLFWILYFYPATCGLAAALADSSGLFYITFSCLGQACAVIVRYPRLLPCDPWENVK